MVSVTLDLKIFFNKLQKSVLMANTAIHKIHKEKMEFCPQSVKHSVKPTG